MATISAAMAALMDSEATETYTPTSTNTFTPSFTYTPTQTFTPTHTFTLTPSHTPTETFTPTITDTPTSTFTKTPTRTQMPAPPLTATKGAAYDYYSEVAADNYPIVIILSILCGVVVMALITWGVIAYNKRRS
jgi:hypothetical protein